MSVHIQSVISYTCMTIHAYVYIGTDVADPISASFMSGNRSFEKKSHREIIMTVSLCVQSAYRTNKIRIYIDGHTIDIISMHFYSI